MEDKKLRVIMFISRNKDNSSIDGFKQRKRTFLSNEDDERLISLFQSFVSDGLPGEFCRLYVTVNSRDNETIKKNLMHYIIDHPNLDIGDIESKLTHIAAQPECRAERQWVFDFDEDVSKLDEFIEDIHSCDSEVEVTSYPTPNGLCVITSRGFDVRELSLDDKWRNVELKKDASRCLFWNTNANV